MTIGRIGRIAVGIWFGQPRKRVGREHAAVGDAIRIENCPQEDAGAAAPHAGLDEVAGYAFRQNQLGNVAQVAQPHLADHRMGHARPIAAKMPLRLVERPLDASRAPIGIGVLVDAVGEAAFDEVQIEVAIALHWLDGRMHQFQIRRPSLSQCALLKKGAATRIAVAYRRLFRLPRAGSNRPSSNGDWGRVAGPHDWDRAKSKKAPPERGANWGSRQARLFRGNRKCGGQALRFSLWSKRPPLISGYLAMPTSTKQSSGSIRDVHLGVYPWGFSLI